MTSVQIIALTKLIRNLLQVGAGFLLARGISLPDADWDTIAGLVIVAGTYVWSLIEGRFLTQKAPTIPVKTDAQ